MHCLKAASLVVAAILSRMTNKPRAYARIERVCSLLLSPPHTPPRLSIAPQPFPTKLLWYCTRKDEQLVTDPGVADGNPAAAIAPGGGASPGDARPAGDGAVATGASGKRGSSEMSSEGGGDSKRPKTKRKAKLEINQANIVDVFKRHGSRLSAKVTGQRYFLQALRVLFRVLMNHGKRKKTRKVGLSLMFYPRENVNVVVSGTRPRKRLVVV